MNRTNHNIVETLESRQLMSATRDVVGYLPEWNASDAMVGRINFHAITAVDYFSVIPNGSGNLPGTGNNHSTEGMSGFSLSRLQHVVSVAKQQGAKVNIVIGGAGDAATNAIQTVLASSSKRATFANSVKQFLQKYKLDGVDIDYEPSGPSNSQISNYGDLLSRVNGKIGSKSLSVAVAAETLPNGDNWDDRRYILNKTAVKAVDRIGVMAYDFTPGAGQSSWDRSFDALNNWGTYANQQQSGAKSKLLLGLPFYGRAGSNDWENPGVTGEASYNDIVTSYAAAHGGALPGADLDDVTATITGDDVGDASGQSVEWHYNGPETIAAKSANAMWSGAAGVMIWDLAQDYFKADGSYDQDHSLLPAVQRGLQSWSQASGRQAVSVFATSNVIAQEGAAEMLSDSVTVLG